MLTAPVSADLHACLSMPSLEGDLARDWNSPPQVAVSASLMTCIAESKLILAAERANESHTGQASTGPQKGQRGLASAGPCHRLRRTSTTDDEPIIDSTLLQGLERELLLTPCNCCCCGQYQSHLVH